MNVVESCEWIKEHIEFSPVDSVPYIGHGETVSDAAKKQDCEPIDIVGSHLFVDGVSFSFQKIQEGERQIPHRSLDKPYMYQCVLRQLLQRFSVQEIADKCDVNRSTIRQHAKEQEVVGKRRTSWEVEDSWEEAQHKVRKRDGECVECGMTDEEHQNRHNRPLTAHHVVPREMFDEKQNANSLDNLVAVCCECHQSYEVTPRQLFLTAVSSQKDI